MKNTITVKKSIFKQEVYRKNKVFNVFGTGISTNPYICPDYEKIDELTLFTCDLEMPLLKKGEEFYIEELNRNVLICKCIRTSKENVCYYIEDKNVEDDLSKESEKKAREEYNDYISFKTTLKYLKDFEEKVKQNFWFKFIKIK